MNYFDIDPFVTALVFAPQYAVRFLNCSRILADTNRGGFVDSFDIDRFVTLLLGN